MKKILWIILGIGVLVLSACGGSKTAMNQPVGTLAAVPVDYAGKTNPFGESEAQLGQDVFDANCMPCHGPSGYGDGPAASSLNPRPVNLAVLQRFATDDYLYWRINTGREGTAMIAWKGILTDEQIWQIIAFIRAFK